MPTPASPFDLPIPAAVWATDRPALAAIRWEAARRIVSPWTVLATALARSLLTIPYPVRYRSELHPEGTPLNALFAFVGRSGAGKSTATHAASTAVRFPSADIVDASTARSGEGIPVLLAYPQAKAEEADQHGIQWKRPDHAIWCHWDEVGMLSAQGARAGATILESVKSVTSGEQLGGQNARGDGLTIPPGTYRAVLTVAVQPRRAGLILDEATIAGGLAARFMWFQAEDLETAERPRPSLPTEVATVTLDHWDGVRYVDALPEMDAAHESDTRAAHRGEREAIASRRQLNRAIVAVALANMDGRSVLDPEDWHLAGCVLAHSDATLDAVLTELAMPEPFDADAEARREAGITERVEALRAQGVAWGDVTSRLTLGLRDTFKRMRAEGIIQPW